MVVTTAEPTQRRIAVLTTSRADYGLLGSVIDGIEADPALDLCLVVSGTHLVPAHGLTARAIEADGRAVSERVEMLLAADTPRAVATSMGLGMIAFAEVLERRRPDLLVVLGDRFEILSAAAAALPLRVPVAHIHGGEATFGALDEQVRHAVTKLSHLHFVATAEYARRVEQLGEEPWRVTVSGAPGLDAIARAPRLSDAELSRRVGLDVTRPTLVVTFHPPTLEDGDPAAQVDAVLATVARTGLQIVLTAPNADAGGQAVAARMEEFVALHPLARLVKSLGTPAYLSLLARARAMVGNSSSGILEAPSFALPVVNVGSRQAGRLRAANVIDVEPEPVDLAAGLATALSEGFRTSLVGLENPYGDGRAAERIVAVLRSAPLGARLVIKRFRDLQERP